MNVKYDKELMLKAINENNFETTEDRMKEIYDEMVYNNEIVAGPDGISIPEFIVMDNYLRNFDKKLTLRTSFYDNEMYDITHKDFVGEFDEI